MFSRFLEAHQREQDTREVQLAELVSKVSSLNQVLDACGKDQDGLSTQLAKMQEQDLVQSAQLADVRRGVGDILSQARDLAHAKQLLMLWRKQLAECHELEKELQARYETLKALARQSRRIDSTTDLIIDRNTYLTKINREFSQGPEQQEKIFENVAQVIAKLPHREDLASLRGTIDAVNQNHSEHADALEQQFDLDQVALAARMSQLSEEVAQLKQRVSQDLEDINQRIAVHQHSHAQKLFVCAWNPQKEQERINALACRQEQERIERNKKMIEGWKSVSDLNLLPNTIAHSISRQIAALDPGRSQAVMRDFANEINRSIAQYSARPTCVHGDTHAFYHMYPGDWKKKYTYQLNLGSPALIRVAAGSINRTPLINDDILIREPHAREKLVSIKKQMDEELREWSFRDGSWHGGDVADIHYTQLRLASEGINEILSQNEIIMNLCALNTLISELNGILSFNNHYPVSMRDISHRREMIRLYPQYNPPNLGIFLDALSRIRRLTPMQDPSVKDQDKVLGITMNANAQVTGSPVQAFLALNFGSMS